MLFRVFFLIFSTILFKTLANLLKVWYSSFDRIRFSVRVGFARSQLLLRRFMNGVIEKAKPVIERTLAALGYELVDVEYKTCYGEKHLIVYIANERGITLDDCEAVSNALDKALDESDPTESQPYCLDVSSPGLDRPFKTQRDYERNYGKQVEVKLFAPLAGTKQKLFIGTLIERDAARLVIKDAQGNDIVIENSQIASARPNVEF